MYALTNCRVFDGEIILNDKAVIVEGTYIKEVIEESALYEKYPDIRNNFV